MKILHVFDIFSPYGGGTTAIIHKISRALTQKGHEVTIYTSDSGLDRKYIESLAGIKVHPFHCISRVANFYLTPSMINDVKRHLKEFHVIHLHCYRSFQNIVIHRYAARYGVPYVLDAHGSMQRKSYDGTNYKRVLKWFFDMAFGNRILRDASRVIAETEKGISEYVTMGVKREKITVITPPFDINEFSSLPSPGSFRRKYNIGEKHIVLFLGRIHRIKGLGFLAESFGELVKSRGNVILVISGSDDGYEAELRKTIGKLGLSHKVIFIGFISGEEKLAALADADVLVQPSVYEQGTGVPFEAILCHTPIIVSRDTVASENVKNIDGGYLVEYGNRAEMTATISHVLDNPEEAGGKTRQAREYIVANLSLEKVVGKYEQLYAEVINPV